MNKKSILSVFSIRSHGEGWYARIASDKNGYTYAGCFATERDAVAYCILLNPEISPTACGVSFYSAADINYIRRNPEEAQTVLIAAEAVRMNRKGWNRPIDQTTLDTCFSSADEVLRK